MILDWVYSISSDLDLTWRYDTTWLFISISEEGGILMVEGYIGFLH